MSAVHLAGRVAEFDKPLSLLDGSAGRGVFKGMVDATGREAAKVLRDIAAGECDALEVDDVVASLEKDATAPAALPAGSQESEAKQSAKDEDAGPRGGEQ